MSTLKQVTIFCDGSSLGNGQQSQRAAAVALLGYKGHWRAVGEYLGRATNQQAGVGELVQHFQAVIDPARVCPGFVLEENRDPADQQQGEKTNSEQ